MIAKQKQALKIRCAGATVHKDFAGADNCIHMNTKHICVIQSHTYGHKTHLCNTITFIWAQNTFV